MKTKRLTMAQALVEFLNNQYISVDGEEIKFVKGVIGVFGHGNVLGLGEALVALSDDNFPYIAGKNEQNNGHIAIGFAKQSKRRQIFAVTSSTGPGAANMITAAATATVNRIPVLFLPGDTFACRQPDPVLQQLEQSYDHNVTTNDAFKPVSKYWDRISRPEQLMTAAINAMRVLTDPAETGAVTLALPQDVQAEAYDYPEVFLQKRVWYIERRQIEPELLKQVVQLIQTKKNPVIVCGGGVRYSNAGSELRAFCEATGIPVAETAAGKGVLPFDYPYNLGALGAVGGQAANLAMGEADLVLAFGTRLSDLTTSSKYLFRNENFDLISFNVNRFDAVKMNGISVLSDAKVALSQVRTELEKIGYRAEYKGEIEMWRKKWTDELDRHAGLRSEDGLRQAEVMRALNLNVEPDAIIVAASGSLPGDMQRSWRVSQPDTYHLEYGYSCMGYEISAALGCKLFQPDRQVYSMMGDGVFLMTHADLHTSLQEKQKLIIIVLDNCGYMCIRALQVGAGIASFGNAFNYRKSGTCQWENTHIPIDFAGIARAYGANGYLATTMDEVLSALDQAKKDTVTALIDIKVLPDTWVPHYESWWRTGVPEVSTIHSVSKHYNEDYLPNVKKLRPY